MRSLRPLLRLSSGSVNCPALCLAARGSVQLEDLGEERFDHLDRLRMRIGVVALARLLRDAGIGDKQTPGRAPQARRVMTENGFCVIYARGRRGVARPQRGCLCGGVGHG